MAAMMRFSTSVLAAAFAAVLLGLGGCDFDLGSIDAPSVEDIADAAQGDAPSWKKPAKADEEEDMPWCPKCDSDDVERTKAGKVGSALGMDGAKDMYKCKKCGHRFQ
jgi:hypothetical protein